MTSHVVLRGLMLAIAAAAVQSCADSAAELTEAPSGAAQPVEGAAEAPCPAGARPAIVGAETHCRLEGALAGEVRLTAGRLYQLAGPVQVGADGAPAALTIEPGVTLYAADRSSSLEVTPGSRIEAIGAPGQPVVFTSAYDLGFDDELGLPPRLNLTAPRGEWRGVAIEGDGAAGASVLREAHIRHAGAFGPLDRDGGAQRAPALTLRNVGAAADIAHLTILNAFGDGLALRGGAVAVRDVAIIGAGDDGIDWAEGWSGRITQAVISHDARLGDADSGLEGAGASTPWFENVTILGDAGASDVGVKLRAGADARFDGVLIAGGFADAAVDVDGAAAHRRLAESDLSGLAIAADGAAAAKDFDDRDLARRLAAAARAPASLSVADALIAAARGFERSARDLGAPATATEFALAPALEEPAPAPQTEIAQLAEPISLRAPDEAGLAPVPAAEAALRPILDL